WHIIDVSIQDTSPYTVIGAKVLNLTHGIPIKDLEKIYKKDQRKNFLKRVYQLVSRQGLKNIRTYILSPNKQSAKHFASAYSTPLENTIICNYPRNCNLVNKEFRIPLTSEECNVLTTLENLKKHNLNLVGYFPTWRSNSSN